MVLNDENIDRRVAVLITCHNRREHTLSCLAELFATELPAGIFFSVILVDDGSTDGTSTAVRAQYPQVEIISGDGNLFWNKGMHLAFARAMDLGFDAYLWLNDDTTLYPTALKNLLATAERLSSELGRACLLVGATEDASGKLSYGGAVALNKIRRFQYRKVWAPDVPVECDVMNGNCVLIPDQVARAVGNIDIGFEHAMGDTDYALRARAKGFPVYVAPGFVGQCSNNPVENTFNDRSLGLSKRWHLIMGRKGLPPKSWLRFTYRHGGIGWVLYFIWPYLKLIITRK